MFLLTVCYLLYFNHFKKITVQVGTSSLPVS